MKTSSVFSAAAAATLFLVPLIRADADNATSAANVPSATAPASGILSDTRQADLIKRFDTNGDGKLDENEKAAAKAAMRAEHSQRGERRHERLLRNYDKNGDGVLDDSERAAALSDLEMRPRFIKRFDQDGDGKLNDAERAAADQSIRQHWEKRAAKNAASPGATVPRPNTGAPAATPQS